tara:strand:+ start:1182 stop:1373 length:192 start_codon:yes stop_codon:yes gene_type:complete
MYSKSKINTQQSKLLGTAEGNLISVIEFGEMPEYQKQWVKQALNAVQEAGENHINHYIPLTCL